MCIRDRTYTELDAFGLAYQPDYGLQPYNCQSLNNRIIFSFLYEPLFAVTDGYEAEPILAESYLVTDDGKTTTVKLRSGVTFHDGSAMTAADAAYSIASAMGSEYYGSRLRFIIEAQAQDDLTLVLATSEDVYKRQGHDRQHDEQQILQIHLIDHQLQLRAEVRADERQHDRRHAELPVDIAALDIPPRGRERAEPGRELVRPQRDVHGEPGQQIRRDGDDPAAARDGVHKGREDVYKRQALYPADAYRAL